MSMMQNKINYLGNKLPATSSTTYFSTPRNQIDIPLQYVRGNVANSLERFDRNTNDFDEFPIINIERKFISVILIEAKSRHNQNAAFIGLPTYSSAFSINPLNTLSNANMPRSMQTSNKNMTFSRNPSVESRQHLKLQSSEESKHSCHRDKLDNIFVNEYSAFTENFDPNIR